MELQLGKGYNISLAKAKWSLWHGNIDKALDKIVAIKNKIRGKSKLEKITELCSYLNSNRERLVDYSVRYRQGEVFTSHLAESTVESLINQRCKGKRHMQWSREGLHPVLQLRAAIASHDWNMNWESYIMATYHNAS